MVEFALILPILVLTIVGILEFGRLFYAWLIIENSTRFGIRYATAGTYDLAECVDLDGDGTPCGGDSELLEIKNARHPSIEDETRRLIVGFHTDESLAQSAIEYLNITVCSDENNFIRPQMRTPGVYAECTGGEKPFARRTTRMPPRSGRFVCRRPTDRSSTASSCATI